MYTKSPRVSSSPSGEKFHDCALERGGCIETMKDESPYRLCKGVAYKEVIYIFGCWSTQNALVRPYNAYVGKIFTYQHFPMDK